LEQSDPYDNRVVGLDQESKWIFVVKENHPRGKEGDDLQQWSIEFGNIYRRLATGPERGNVPMRKIRAIAVDGRGRWLWVSCSWDAGLGLAKFC
jgi:hypothetical protein